MTFPFDSPTQTPPDIGARAMPDGHDRRHGRRRAPARTTPRSSLRTPTNQPRHSPLRVVEKVGRSITNSETPQFRCSANDLARPSQAAKFALRSIAQRIQALDREIVTLDRELKQLVATAAPRTVQLLGSSTGHAGQLLVTAGQNIDRLRGESSFAMLCGASPLPASSGKTVRHRLNPGGDRQANRALHRIVVVRLRYCQRTRAYVQRRAREGMSQREIMRCLKRYIAREVYNSLRADLADTNPRPRPPIATTIMCGNPGFGINRTRT